MITTREEQEKICFMGAMIQPTDCRRCGLCCNVWWIPITQIDIDREPKIEERQLISRDDLSKTVIFNNPDEIFVMGNDDVATPCFFHSPDGCTIYETRPNACRNFTTMPKNCMGAYIKGQTGIDTKVTAQAWEEEGIPQLVILSRIYGLYLKLKTKELKEKVRIVGSISPEQELRKDILLKLIHEQIMSRMKHHADSN